MSETSDLRNGHKPVPNDPYVVPAMDADRRHNTNLTPEGDLEPAANIPPSATDPE